MPKVRVNGLVKIAVTVSFLIMVTVNTLANILPIAGQTTAEVSDSYSNLFAPAGMTFSIWGLIYLLLAFYVLYQLGLFRKDTTPATAALLNHIGIYFTLSSIANALWVFAWHNKFIPVSMLYIIIILICLIMIYSIINSSKLTLTESICVRLPFSIYHGWITVATFANATVLLVYLNWNGFSIPEPVWTVFMLIIGALIGLTITLKNKDMAYGIVFIWAYAGVILKHTDPAGFNGSYPSVIITACACVALFIIAELFVYISVAKKKVPVGSR